MFMVSVVNPQLFVTWTQYVPCCVTIKLGFVELSLHKYVPFELDASSRIDSPDATNVTGLNDMISESLFAELAEKDKLIKRLNGEICTLKELMDQQIRQIYVTI